MNIPPALFRSRSPRLRAFIPLLGGLLVLTCSAGPALSPDLLAPGGWNLATVHPGDATLQPAAESDAPEHGELLHITVSVPSEPAWSTQIARAIPADIPAGHLVWLHFWARSPTQNPLRVTIEHNGPPYDGPGAEVVQLSPEWQEFKIGGQSLGTGANSLGAHFQVGKQKGVIDIAGATVTDGGVDPGLLAAQIAVLPEQTQARIEKFRKGDLAIKVVNAAGAPVTGATVKVEQKRHAFLFGSDFFLLNPSDPSLAQLKYQAKFSALFNYATLPFYWGAFAEQQSHPEYARLDAMAAWCARNEIAAKGHPLIYHEVWPKWAPTSPDAAIPMLHARVSDLIGHYKDTIHYWDVVNEANGAQWHSPANGESAWIDRDGPASMVGTALDWARSAAQDTGGTPETFLYNDYDTSISNVALLTKLQAAGKLPDAIGIQAHMHTGQWPLTKAWQVCEEFGKFGKPIHLSEMTVLSGPYSESGGNNAANMVWKTTPEGEAKQADYVEQIYTLLFSHPAVRAISWWDFSDYHGWKNAPCGMLRDDMSPKPVYNRLLALIHKKWRTNTEGKVDQAGVYATRVFYGDYLITVTDAGGKTTTQSVVFPEAGQALNVTVKVP